MLSRFYKILLTIPLIFAVLVTTLAVGQPKPAQKNWLMAMPLDSKEEKFVGAMANQATCEVIARTLNEWGKVPPVTPLNFYCMAPMVKA
jgi:hypothetical protein